MAKGTHNKTHKRNMAIINKVMEEKIYKPRREATSIRLLKRAEGQGDDTIIQRKKNAFRYPNDKDAIYPQCKRIVPIERRAMYLPTEYLIKHTGEKHKNKYEREYNQRLQHELDKIDGKANEGKEINEEDMEEISIKENKNSVEGMDIDDMNYGISKTRFKRKKQKGYRHKRHSKNSMKF